MNAVSCLAWGEAVSSCERQGGVDIAMLCYSYVATIYHRNRLLGHTRSEVSAGYELFGWLHHVRVSCMFSMRSCSRNC
jgi:hypothetical protein